MNATDDRLHEVGQERANVEAHVAECHRGHTAKGICTHPRVGVIESPVQVEVGQQARERRIAAKACGHFQVEIRDGRQPRAEDLPKIGARPDFSERQPVVVRVGIFEVDCELPGEPRRRCRIIRYLKLQEGQPPGSVEAGSRDFEIDFEFISRGRIEIKSVRPADADAEIETPAQLCLNVAVHVHAQARQAEIER